MVDTQTSPGLTSHVTNTVELTERFDEYKRDLDMDRESLMTYLCNTGTYSKSATNTDADLAAAVKRTETTFKAFDELRAAAEQHATDVASAQAFEVIAKRIVAGNDLEWESEFSDYTASQLTVLQGAKKEAITTSGARNTDSAAVLHAAGVDVDIHWSNRDDQTAWTDEKLMLYKDHILMTGLRSERLYKLIGEEEEGGLCRNIGRLGESMRGFLASMCSR